MPARTAPPTRDLVVARKVVLDDIVAPRSEWIDFDPETGYEILIDACSTNLRNS
jgi:hypothetical protein